MAKKKQRGNGQGTVAPRKNKDGKIIGYRGAFFGPDGKRRWVSAKTKTECWAKLNAAMTDVDRGILPSPATLTVDRYLSTWLTDSIEGKLARASHDAYKRDVHYHIIPALGRRKLKDLSTPDDPPFLPKEARRRSLKPEPRIHPHHPTQGTRRCQNDGIITRNPTDGVKPHKTPQGAAKESKALDPIQVRALLSAASGDRLEALYVVALHTGLRRGEALGLLWRTSISKRARFR